MSIFRRINEFIMKLRGAKEIDIELYRLRRNIMKDDAQLEQYDRLWRETNSPCCPACMFGSRYNEICDRQERRLAMERVLLQRKNRYKY